jgi:hypothetical protein
MGVGLYLLHANARVQVGGKCFVSFSRSSDILLSTQLILPRAEMTFFLNFSYLSLFCSLEKKILLKRLGEEKKKWLRMCKIGLKKLYCKQI